jgi:1-deoxy-D-xylulose-5-phosphate reductoisomerase
LGRLDFQPPDLTAFPCLDLAFRALRAGPAASTVLNAANEIAVSAFLQRRAAFLAIPDLIAACLDALAAERAESLEELLALDARARQVAEARLAA